MKTKKELKMETEMGTETETETEIELAPRHFVACLRTMFCMPYNTFLTLMCYGESDRYTLEMFNVMKSNPAAFLCRLDNDSLNSFIKRLM